MTDTTASNPAPESQDQACPQNDPSPTLSGPSSLGQNWEVVTFPGQIVLEENLAEPKPVQNFSDPSVPESVVSNPSEPPSRVGKLQSNTGELIQLIQDLNHCNDALLLRISDLEESLERSQAALQAEVERNQQAMASTGESPVPQQIAQLLTELDIANDGLRRATIHNETLQTELEANQQRVAQLERECTLLQQRFSEKSTALHQAEDTCRDLKARLHRQQRYTLQFKTALEKCLNMAGDHNSAASTFAPITAQVETAQPVSMPKAQEIQPWSAKAPPASDQDHLAQLLHTLKAPAQNTQASPLTPPLAAATVQPPPAATDHSHRPEPSPAVPVSSAPERPFEPSLEPSRPLEPMAEEPLSPDPWLTPSPITQKSAEAPVFTEPSPWGAPLPQPPATPEPAVTTPEVPTLVAPTEPMIVSAPPSSPLPQAPLNSPEIALPAYLQQDLKPSPSPVVYPQRSQKKIGSLSAVQLPSFGRSPRRS